MNINPEVYESKYHVSCNAGGTYTIDFTDNILTLNREDKLPLGEPMDESNSYCGFDPTKENNFVNPCKYGYIQFNPENVREVNIVSREYRKQINYRLMLSANTSYGGVPLEFRKTRFTNNVSPITSMDSDTLQYKLLCDSSMGYLDFKGVYSIVDRMYPVTDIDYDKLIICPVFHIFVVDFTYTGDVITGAGANTSYRRYYSEVKPEDKTAAGAYYDEDLWNNGFKDEFDENNRLIRRTIVEVAYCTIHYGKSNRQAFNYGNFADNAWNYDGDRVLPNNNRTWYALCPMIEYVDDITGSIFYSDIPGLQFPRQDNYGWQNRQELFNFTTTTYKTLNNFGRNTMMNTPSTFGYECIVLNNDSNNIGQSFTALTHFATNYQNDFTGHTGFEYIPLDDGSIISANAQNGITLITKAYPIKDLMASVASLGFLIASDYASEYTTDLETFPNTMYRGNMTSDGITDGTWVQGEDIADVPKISEVDYKPISPGGGGGDDDDSSGDNITPYNFVNTPLGAANNFITLYSLNTSQVADFGRRMWASLSDTAFWESVGTVFLNDFSINPADMMKYFVSLRYFPFDLSIVHSSQTWGIYIGRSSYPIQPSIGTELPHRITMNLVQLDGGSVFVPNNYNDFRDYEPYTKVSVTVPFCGVLELTPSEVVGKTLYLDYVIDLQTGTIKATVSVQSNTFFIVGSLSGVCGSQIPLTANNNIEFLQRIANVGSSIISSGSSAGNAADTVAGLTGSGAIGAVAGGVVMGANAVGSMLSLPPITVHKQGNATGFANYGGSSQAYLTVQRQKYIVPDNYGHSVGYATAFSSVLSSLSGFTVCSNVDLSGFTCHEDERSEIKALLESGVYL